MKLVTTKYGHVLLHHFFVRQPHMVVCKLLYYSCCVFPKYFRTVCVNFGQSWALSIFLAEISTKFMPVPYKAFCPSIETHASTYGKRACGSFKRTRNIIPGVENLLCYADDINPCLGDTRVSLQKRHNTIQKTCKFLQKILKISLQLRPSAQSTERKKKFLDSFAKLRKATIGFVLFIRPSVGIEQLGSHWTVFMKFNI